MSPSSGASRLPIWLIVSVAINLLFIGAIAGRMLAPAPASSASEQNARAGLERAPRFGGAENPRAAREQLRAAWNETSDLRADLGGTRDNLKAAIAADPYVPEDVDDAFAAMREAENRLQEASHAYLSDALAQTPASERAALAEMMLRGRGRHGRVDRRNHRNDRRRLSRDQNEGDERRPHAPPPDQP